MEELQEVIELIDDVTREMGDQEYKEFLFDLIDNLKIRLETIEE